MEKTGYEIVGMVAKGEAPQSIKFGSIIYYFDNDIHDYKDITGDEINLLNFLNDEFEIIEDKVWKPKDSEEYWYLNDDGGIILTKWKYSIIDKLRYDIGNCFKTKEEAEKYLEKIKIYTQLKRYAEEHNGYKIDWNNKRQTKWFICYDFEDKEIITIDTIDIKDIGQIYFTSKELAEQAIQEIGEDNIKKLMEEE